MTRHRLGRAFTTLALLCLSSILPRGVSGQGPSAVEIPQEAFEVASVRRSTDVNAARGVRPPGPGGRFTAVVSVTELVQVAYGVPNALFAAQVVGGPDWARLDLWEINARIEGSIFAGPGGPPVRLLGMMRTLLSERFKLRLREETRQLPVYDLVLDRADGRLGQRLKPADGTCLPITAATGPITDFTPYCGFKRFSPIAISAKGTTMEGLAGSVAFLADVQRLVRDRTGLTGAFDFDLEFAPLANPDPQASPMIFTALKEQLGLQLRSTTGPVNVFVIEQLELPTPD
jgi:uncharacterized protein (TIGR03435 family)